MLALIFSLVEEGIKLEPAIAAELKAVLDKPNPTPEDWAAAKAKRLGATFEFLAPDAKLS